MSYLKISSFYDGKRWYGDVSTPEEIVKYIRNKKFQWHDLTESSKNRVIKAGLFDQIEFDKALWQRTIIKPFDCQFVSDKDNK